MKVAPINARAGHRGFHPVPLADRIGRSVERRGECLVWKGHIGRSGYARLTVNKRGIPAHRVAYELAKGPIPQGCVIDHLCRNRACLNPDHLEAVSQRENIIRGTGQSAQNAAKTHCKYGHPLSGDNLLVGSGRGGRICRTCKRARKAKCLAKKRAVKC